MNKVRGWRTTVAKLFRGTAPRRRRRPSHHYCTEALEGRVLLTNFLVNTRTLP